MSHEEDHEQTVVIDADAHVIEAEQTWEFMESKYSEYRPTLFMSEEQPGREYWVIDGKIAGFRLPSITEKQMHAQSEQTGRLVAAPSDARDMSDVRLRLEGMDQLGIDLQVLHNSLWIESTTDKPEVDGALCGSWNRWMGDIYAQGEGRLFWSCVVPAFDHDVAIHEMRRARENGAVALCLRPYEGNLIITDPYFYPLFAEAVRLDMPIALHIGNGSPVLTELLKTRHASASGGWAPFRIPAVLAAMSIMASPVTAQFPTLRWGIIEASASWVPWLWHELQRRTGRTFTPEENLFRESNLYVSAQVDDDIPYITEKVGEETLLLGTDFGHTDASSEYDALMKLRNSNAISEGVKRKMLSENPAAFYALEHQARVARATASVSP